MSSLFWDRPKEWDLEDEFVVKMLAEWDIGDTSLVDEKVVVGLRKYLM